MAEGKNVPPIQQLHENITQFFDRFHSKYRDEMKCGKGCSKCCVGGLTVFPTEAQYIADWVLGLSEPEQDELLKIWQNDVSRHVSRSDRCSFLINDICTIYPVRPVLCRGQGLPMRVRATANQSEEDSENFELSLCELNFSDEAKIPAVSDWLDLDRVNVLLSVAQKYAEKSSISDAINNIAEPSSQRVPLTALKDYLLQKLR